MRPLTTWKFINLLLRALRNGFDINHFLKFLKFFGVFHGPKKDLAAKVWLGASYLMLIPPPGVPSQEEKNWSAASLLRRTMVKALHHLGQGILFTSIERTMPAIQISKSNILRAYVTELVRHSWSNHASESPGWLSMLALRFMTNGSQYQPLFHLQLRWPQWGILLINLYLN